MAVSAYDKTIMSQEDQKKLQGYTDAWNAATSATDKAAYNQAANALRANYNYSMGADGNTYTPLQTVYNTAGVPINPVQAGLQKIDTSNFLNGAQAQATAQKSQAYNDYLNNITNMATTYNQNRADALNTMNDTQKNFQTGIKDAYKSAYANNNSVMENATANGLTSTGLGAAMRSNGLARANDTVANLVSDRNYQMSNLQNQLDSLSANYNISKDAAAAALANTYQGIDADAYSNYFKNWLSAETTNTNNYNDYILAAMGYDASAIENMKEREVEKNNLAAELAQQIELAKLEQQGNIDLATLQGNQELEKIKLMHQLGMA